MDFSLIPTAFAATSPIFDPSATYEPGDLITFGISLVVLIAGLFAVMFIIWGGVMLILSGWKDEKVKPAINSIRYAVLWVIVIIISIFVAPRAWDLLGLNVSWYLSPSTIFSTIKVLANRIFGSQNNPTIETTSDLQLGDDFSNLDY